MPEPVINEPKVVSQSKVWTDAPIIEEYESDSDDEHVSLPSKEQETLSFANTIKYVKTPRQTVKKQNTCSKSPKPDKKDCSALMSKKLGLGYGFTKKACFVCDSFSHLIRDCDFHEKRMAKQAEVNKRMCKGTGQRENRPVWNNVNRVNHQNQFVPTAILTRDSSTNNVNTVRASSTKNVNTTSHNFNSQAVPTNAARKVNTVKPIVNNGRPKTIFHKTYSPSRRLFNRTTAPRTKFSNQKVNTTKVKAVSVDGGKRETSVKPSAGCNWRPKRHYWNKVSKYNGGSNSRNYYPQRVLKNKGIVDNGCSRHMTGNKAYLAEYQDYNGGPVAFRGIKGYISGKGKIKTRNLDFEDVCFVKELQHFNLFSVSQMCDKKNKVLFTDTECLVLSPDFKLLNENQVLLRVPRQNNMYSFNLQNIVPSGGFACLITKATVDESNKWHRRLGHVNFKNLNKLVKGNLVRGLPSKIFQNDHTCFASQKGKQHKASCKAKSVSSICQPLQLLHMDLFGPTSVRSLNHKTYCLVITDDFSRFSWVFFLRTKDETSGILKDFIRQIENQLNQKVKTIRCDNGTEFKNRDFIEFCGSKGIKREYSNARTPQQNGVAERKNKTLIEAAKTMLADSFLPNTFWAEAVSTACYVLNRVLVTKPQNKTPYELITGKIPIISYIRTFEVPLCPSLNTFDPSGKFVGKSNEGFLVGYSLQMADFKNLETIVNVNPIPTSRINYIHPSTLILGDPKSAVQTRSKVTKSSGAHAFVSYIQKQRRNNHKDFQHCLFACFLSQINSKRSFDALKDERNRQKIGTKWVYRNKKDERGVVVRNKARLVAQGHRQEEGIDYDEEVYVSQPSRFYDLEYYPRRSKKVVKVLYVYTKLIEPDNYVAKILKKFNFVSVKIASTPIETQKPLVKDEEASEVDVHLYRSMIGSLMYLTASRPDIMYLKGKPKLGLWYPRVSSFNLEACSDSDYAGVNLDRGKILLLLILLWASLCIQISNGAKNTTDDNVADLLTKAFDVSRFQFLVIIREDDENKSFMRLLDFLTRKLYHYCSQLAGNPVTISEASIRSDLCFDDVDGIDSLNNQAIFNAIKLMGEDVGSEGGLTLQSVYDLYLSLCTQVTAQAAEIHIVGNYTFLT
ncbi:putative ribonuclease H-like domain-containing protein [Tanacetum coccineum]|uniref:Ribonuclease H-like domain-containing protein n=1 Tax=Tanacetum coccineum TaxID=301880 RepID=A0ABQ4YE82_9ASTR